MRQSLDLTKFVLLDSSEDQRPTFIVPAGQINPRTSEENLRNVCLACLDGIHDGSVTILARSIPAVTSLLTSENLHTLLHFEVDTLSTDSCLGQSPSI